MEKAVAAEESGAAGLIVVNSDNGDLFEIPAGYDLTEDEIKKLPDLPVVLVPRNALDVLKHVER